MQYQLKFIQEKLEQLLQQNTENDILVAIDGNCAAGKTTLAGELAQRIDCNVIHMDDFFLRPEQRTEERLQQPGGNIDWERFQKEVLLPLVEEKTFSYRPFSCRTMQLSDSVHVGHKRITIIEGSYACHPELVSAYDFKIFLSLTKPQQIDRIRVRNGEERLSDFVQKWIPMEERYFQTFDIKNQCELVVEM